jgi:hypothetical protein
VPMNLGEFHHATGLHNGHRPLDENGYLVVEYTDGGKPNVEGCSGLRLPSHQRRSREGLHGRRPAAAKPPT